METSTKALQNSQILKLNVEKRDAPGKLWNSQPNDYFLL